MPPFSVEPFIGGREDPGALRSQAPGFGSPESLAKAGVAFVGRGQEQHPDEGHDHALRVVRRGRARPDSPSAPARAFARARSSGRKLGRPKGLPGFTARRQGGPKSSASSELGQAEPYSDPTSALLSGSKCERSTSSRGIHGKASWDAACHSISLDLDAITDNVIEEAKRRVAMMPEPGTPVH